MKKFVVEVYGDNDITENEVYVELLSRFGNMIASVKEEVQTNQVCDECGKVFSHYTGCSLAKELPRHQKAVPNK